MENMKSSQNDKDTEYNRRNYNALSNHFNLNPNLNLNLMINLITSIRTVELCKNYKFINILPKFI